MHRSHFNSMLTIMKTTTIYYLILFVYISLWACQMVACHLTHSLIILTDSYINLYKILDISLGIIHLQTQNKFKSLTASKGTANAQTQHEVHLFGRICSYQFKRLPVLGTFVNGLFLGALLVSAAIEGIQTCFHASHLAAESEKSILLEHPLTYPGILVGFSIVGLLMQWCSNNAHRLREEELDSESLIDVRSVARHSACSNVLNELSAQQLNSVGQVKSSSRLPKTTAPSKKRHSICLGNAMSFCHQDSQYSSKKFVLNSTRQNGTESVPTNLDDAGKVSLRSLRVMPDHEATKPAAMISISGDIESRVVALANNSSPLVESATDKWHLVRYCVSPVALIVCAVVVYYAREGSFLANNRELVAEIADASLAIIVVTLLFTASYPPMKKAGKVLLQSAPNEIDVTRLKENLKSANELIVDIQELHIWSLTTNNNRVATCRVVLNRDRVSNEDQLSIILGQLKAKFLDDNIKCSTIQPVFSETLDANRHHNRS